MDTAAEMPNPRGRVLGTGVSLNVNRRDLVGAYLDAASAAITEFGGNVAKKFATDRRRC